MLCEPIALLRSKNKMTPHGRLGMEFLATADALRECRRHVSQLLHEGNPAVSGRVECGTVLGWAGDVADALVALAGVLALEKLDDTPPSG